MDYKADKVLNELESFLKKEDEKSYYIYLFANESTLTMNELLDLKVDDITVEEDILIKREN